MSDRTVIEALQARLQRLEDLAEIQQVIARYGPMVDYGDGDGVAALWQEDGVYEVAGLARFSGRDNIKAMIAGDMHQGLITAGCAHFQAAPAIDLDGDRATATGHSVLLTHNDGDFRVFRVSSNRWELARGDDGWQVTHRTNALLNGDAAAKALLNLRGA